MIALNKTEIAAPAFAKRTPPRKDGLILLGGANPKSQI
jgi:hypothetical protein